MAQTRQPAIAHGIARLHPDQGIGSQWQWGPEWSLPIDRKGRWVIDKIYNVGIRVEFDEAVPVDIFGYQDRLDAAREALSADDEKRRDEWLGWADKREGAAFVRRWTARVKRERGDLPTFDRGAYIREGWRSSGVWHIATGRTHDSYTSPEHVRIGSECSADLNVDLGDEHDKSTATIADPGGNVCKRCQARVSNAPPARSPEKVLVPA